ncbi:MAG: hypothetical protein KDB00_16195 [Planctomycetales bacterium]|nr:hypothetical protein [Planctomycetales bacterium]
MHDLSQQKILICGVVFLVFAGLMCPVHSMAQEQETDQRETPRRQDKHLSVPQTAEQEKASGISGRKPMQLQESNEIMRTLNVGFAFDPGVGNYDGVVGSAGDVWNFVSVGTTAKDFMRNSDMSASTARIRISRHDGAWGIKGHEGVFHGYIYDNCQCKDLEVAFLDLQPGSYKAYVFAHGDAPNQNANIEIVVGGKSLGSKATANDGTYGYRSHKMIDGVQYVSFDFGVGVGDEVRFISHRDGSGYSMFNAIQLVPTGDDRSNRRTAASSLGGQPTSFAGPE